METRYRKNQELNAFLIGTGGQGARRGYSIKLSNGWKLAGVFDKDSNLGSRMAMKWKCKCYSDLQAGLNDETVDLVVIATPPSYHDELIEMAINAGKHVLCEKPLTINALSAQKLAEKAEANGLIMATGFNHRFYKPVMDAVDLLKNQELGEFIQVHGRIGQKPEETDLNGWLGNYEISGGGVLTDNGSHLIDLIQMFSGQLNQVQKAEVTWDERRENIELLSKAEITGNHGFKAYIECSWMESDEPYLSIDLKCERGSIRISAFPWRLEILPTGGKKTVRNYWDERLFMKYLGLKSLGLERSLMREMASLRRLMFGEQINSGFVSIATGYDGASVARVVESIREASLLNSSCGSSNE